MSSYFGWVDFSEEDRQKMLDVIKLFSEEGTRDELGIGSIRDAFADYFFPGTSTIQTRARYMFFIPWIYQELEKKRVPSKEISHAARKREIKLIYALKESDDTNGVIGIREEDGLQRLPSNIYWSGLRSWGILRYNGSQYQYHQFLDTFYNLKKNMVISDDKEPVDGLLGENWDPGLPKSPDDLLDHAELKLKKDEALYLIDRIQFHHQGSLLSFLVADNEAHDVDFFWNHPIIESLPQGLKRDIFHSQNFSETIHGASLLYNLMLAKARDNEELIDEYIERLNNWAEDISARFDELITWYKDLDAFWTSSAFKLARIPRPTQFFVEEWYRIIFNKNSLFSIFENQSAQKLIRDREIRLKRARARLQNQRALEMWNGAAGDRQLDFRWNTVKAIVQDIIDGLEGE